MLAGIEVKICNCNFHLSASTSSRNKKEMLKKSTKASSHLYPLHEQNVQKHGPSQETLMNLADTPRLCKVATVSSDTSIGTTLSSVPCIMIVGG